METVKLMRELIANFEQERNYLPKETGLRLIESTGEVVCSTVAKYKCCSHDRYESLNIKQIGP